MYLSVKWLHFFLCEPITCVFAKVCGVLQKCKFKKKSAVYLIIVQAVNVLLEFILYKDKYLHEILCIWGKK